MKRIFLDIETLPTVEENRRFVEKKLDKSLFRRGEILSADDYAERAEFYFRETALSGSLGRLLCIGLMIDIDGQAQKSCVCGQDKETGEFHLDEARTLRQFWNYLNRINFNPNTDWIVGHNILSFDLPFLYQRSMICDVKPTRRLLEGKPWELANYIYDTMQAWQMGKCRDFVSLDELALAFGLKSPKAGAVNGENLFEAFLSGRHSEIREYCLADVGCVRELYYRMTFQKMPVTAAAPDLALAG